MSTTDIEARLRIKGIVSPRPGGTDPKHGFIVLDPADRDTILDTIATLRADLAAERERSAALDAMPDVRWRVPDKARALVAQQAEDEGLWFVAVTASEAYLQRELRRLHAAIEGEPIAFRNELKGAPTPPLPTSEDKA